MYKVMITITADIIYIIQKLSVSAFSFGSDIIKGCLFVAVFNHRYTLADLTT